ncbi:restriction endonuclease subunit S [Escherichia coli]|uniref:restriction endonuclease subunit S n=1 Tax=Escherichia coli TaxID=562 RepID=UPI000BE5D487|nr:restriction endonuclease subunit S [Escherichia coli]EEZ6203284.1 restriction endonuclease subunit S [Escherichia coli O8]MCC7826902.1 restriction endonuclease subunit S [Escherichia coli]MCU6341857.1 restriction endonuclease subunit S [Escherichia coli]MED0549994.1 restriction endonuclease subunit S [Escherichia coli]MED0580568.1 restriction endonuclease subunit S [Escherichia coli]
MSVEKLIVDHMETWTSALQTRSTAGRGSSGKIDLYGIKKLRELILELAVRGKLVPQDPNDEPASELLKRIAAEKAELVKQGKIKKQKPLPEISEEEKPFELPEGWEWVALQEICSLENGDRSKNYPNKSTLVETGIPFVNAGHLENGNIRQEDMTFITPEHFSILRSGKFLDGDILFCLRGSLGKSAIVQNLSGAIASSLVIVRVFKPTFNKYIHLYFDAPLSYDFINKYDNGTAQPNLAATDLARFLVPLPPLDEQSRIVNKITELMSLCDQLEQQSLTTLDAHQQLVETLLGTLTDSQNAEELAENWARISEHFDTLFTTEASVDALKQTILQLAVMGKLVPQDPNDEPASELLKRIAQEKAQLVKEGKIKKQKPLPPISNEEKPFELPEGWEWCRLGDCINLISGQHLKPDEYSDEFNDNFLPYITGPAEFGMIHPTYSKYTNERRAIAEKGDILITCKGAGLGKLNIANTRIAISRQLMAIGAIGINSTYLKITLDSMYDYFQSKGVGIAIPGISREDVLEPTIMLPPVQEQINIIDQFMMINNILDCLKEKIKSAKQTQLHLADALTDAAIN